MSYFNSLIYEFKKLQIKIKRIYKSISFARNFGIVELAERKLLNSLYGWFRQLLTSVCTWNFLDFFKAALSTLYTHRIIKFSKTLISNHFLLGLWMSKKMLRLVTLCKRSLSFLKKILFFRSQCKKVLKIENWI